MTTRANDLVAAIVTQNTDDAAHTANALLDYEKANARRLAQAFLRLDAAIEACAVVDRRLLDAQEAVAGTLTLAYRYTSEEAKR